MFYVSVQSPGHVLYRC